MAAVSLLAALAAQAADRRDLPGGFQPAPAEPGAERSWKRAAAPAARAPAPSFLDPANPDHAQLQPPAEAYAGLPRDRRGAPDWMAALRQGAIQPRAGLEGEATPQVFDLDVIMPRTRSMPAVRFSHRAHGEWLACSNCHPAPFLPRVGANPLRMADIFRGKGCGICHGSVAFVPFLDCERCHSGAPAKAGHGRG
jgi:c(7)-type cytochrome triheme protein